MTALSYCRLAKWHKGLTLIELMVALVMGLVLLGGVVTVFVANKQTYRFQDALARLQENGRYALLTLERDIRVAGNFGCVARLTFKENLVREGATWYPLIGSGPVWGSDGKPSDAAVRWAIGSWYDKLVSGADVLTLMGADDEGIRITKHNKKSAVFHTTKNAPVCKGDIVMATDCQSGSIVQLTNVQNVSGKQSTLVHNPGAGSADPGNYDKETRVSYAGNGQIVRLGFTTYFLATTDRGVPALFRAGFSRPETCDSGKSSPTAFAEELVEGVEDMQITYGVDQNKNNQIDDNEPYMTATDITAGGINWDKVRSVRVSLLLSSVDPNALAATQDVKWSLPTDDYHAWDKTGTDRRWRQGYVTTVALRNWVP